MRQVDLGDIQGPILIFGGAYSNLQATQALIDAARDAWHPSRTLYFYWGQHRLLRQSIRNPEPAARFWLSDD